MRRPPRVARALLNWILPENENRVLRADIDEIHAMNGSRMWYWRQVLGTVAHRRTLRAGVFTSTRQDLRYGLRVFRSAPVFSMTAVLSLAIAIGASTGIFSIIDVAMLRPLPYPSPDRLVHILAADARGASTTVSYPAYAAWQTRARAVTAVAAYDETNVTVSLPSGATMIRGARVSSSFFSLLGAAPALGTMLTTADDVPDGTRNAVLGHELWQREFGGRADILGTTLRIGAVPFTIVGVAPTGFRFAPAGDAELWLPLGGSAEERADPTDGWLRVIARLGDGVTPVAAASEFRTLADPMATDPNSRPRIDMMSLQRFISGDLRPVLWLVAAAVTLLLIITCTNVTGLLFGRGLARRAEMAVRTALGAGRSRIIAQLLTESLLLAVIGSALGVVFASVLLHVWGAHIPVVLLDRMPYLRDARVDARVLAFASLVTASVVIAIGLAPAFATAGAATSLRPGARVTQRGGAIRDWLVGGQIAFTVVLLVTALLLARSVNRLLDVDTGFDATDVSTGRIALAGPRYQTEDAVQQFIEVVIADVRRIPGVTNVGAISNLPLNGGGSARFTVDGDPAAPRDALVRAVAGDYLDVMRIPMQHGRVLTPRDDADAVRAVMINASLAAALAGDGGAAIGRRLRFTGDTSQIWTVVGVTGNVKTGSLVGPPAPTMYVSHLQAAENRMSLVIRSERPTGELSSMVQSGLRAVDSDVPFYSVRPLSEDIATSAPVFMRQYSARLITFLSAAAMLLAAIGLYGVISLAVAQRSREFAIRKALGGESASITMIVLRHTSVLLTIGVLAGWVLSVLAAGSLRSLVFGVAAVDAETYALAGVVMLLIAALATSIPLRRALRVPPAAVLRDE